MNNSNSDSLLSIFLSSLGWVLLVAMSAFFFLVAKPQYYQQGAQDQHQLDVEVIDKAFEISGDVVDAIPASIVRILDGSLTVESNLIPGNPLRPLFPAMRGVTLTESTQFLERSGKTAEEFQAEVEASTEGGADVLPYTEVVGSIENIAEGDLILIVPEETENIGYLETMTAYQIIKDVTPETTTVPSDLPVALQGE